MPKGVYEIQTVRSKHIALNSNNPKVKNSYLLFYNTIHSRTVSGPFGTCIRQTVRNENGNNKFQQQPGKKWGEK